MDITRYSWVSSTTRRFTLEDLEDLGFTIKAYDRVRNKETSNLQASLATRFKDIKDLTNRRDMVLERRC
ncbi:unnamed protein product [Rhizophagus irregularis]|nr:unnamed protein product [Rhizophagus irregularis]CAB4420206.1 unnamed protein product [Rhizophagus irregularis]